MCIKLTTSSNPKRLFLLVLLCGFKDHILSKEFNLFFSIISPILTSVGIFKDLQTESTKKKQKKGGNNSRENSKTE